LESIISTFNLNPEEFIFIAGCAAIFLVTLILVIFFRDQVPPAESIEPQVDGSSVPEQQIAPTEPVEEAVLTQQQAGPEDQAVIEETAEQQTEDFIAKTDTRQTVQTEEIEKTVVDDAEQPQASQEQIIEEIAKEPEVTEQPEAAEESFFSRLRSGLSKTRTGFIDKLDLIISRKEIDGEVWEEFEETLVMADLGVTTTMKLREDVENEIERKSITDPREIKNILKSKILEILKESEGRAAVSETKPFIMMVAGVNGVGKTTTIGKLAYKFKGENKNVMVAAADTFRAAAVDQLEIWANRVGTDFIRGQSGADPSAVAFDAVKASVSRGADVLIIDTAGRLHTRENLMDELKKMRKVISREFEGAPHETILVLDATTGQNAVQQAKMFNDAIDLTGIALTKLDGTAKGGVIISIANELNIPVKYIGIGERLEDLREFNAEEFVEALFVNGSETIH
jgi:fused signal recognition particle receptor